MKKIAFAALAFLLAVAVLIFFKIESVDEHYAVTETTSGTGSVMLSVSCAELIDNESVPQSLIDSGVIPKDGIIIPSSEYPLFEGETAFDILRSALKSKHIHFDYTSISDKSVYVKGINNIYEYDCGDLSGWMYSVNGDFPTVSSSEYVLNDGDVVIWMYTCDLGRDIGDTYYTKSGGIDHED